MLPTLGEARTLSAPSIVHDQKLTFRYVPGEFSPPEINEELLGHVIVYTKGRAGHPVLNRELSKHPLAAYDGEASPER